MRNERLTILLSQKEKRAVMGAAQKSGVSAGEWARDRLLKDASPALKPVRPDRGEGAPAPSAAEIRMLEAAAETALASFAQANASLDKAFAEIAETKKYFAGKRKAKP